jgi:hypothetical protein
VGQGCVVGKYLVNEVVNIDICPTPDNTLGVTEACIGDLHGNAVKLLYFLVRHGICDISSADYTRFVEIYRTPLRYFTSELIDEFNSIASRIEVVNPNLLVRLIGDEMGDRGSNDYFVLKILQQLHLQHANVEIILSNHGCEFIEASERYTQRKNRFQVTMMEPYTNSLRSLAALVEHGLVSAESVFDIVDTAYKPMLKLIGYSLDPETEGITIFTHAGVGLETIRELAKKFGVDYKDHTGFELAATIERINAQFSKYVHEDRVHELYSPQEMAQGYYGSIKRKKVNPIEFIIWNRAYENLERPLLNGNKLHHYPIYFVHGHDSADPTKGNIVNLDTLLGKSPHHHKEEYRAYYSDDVPLHEIWEKKTRQELQKIENKLEDLLNRKELRAYRAAKKLYQELEKSINAYFANPNKETYITYKTNCHTLIENALGELETHRGWAQILGNLALFIAGLGIFYVGAMVLNKLETGRFLFFTTDTSKRIDSFEATLCSAAPAA